MDFNSREIVGYQVTTVTDWSSVPQPRQPFAFEISSLTFLPDTIAVKTAAYISFPPGALRSILNPSVPQMMGDAAPIYTTGVAELYGLTEIIWTGSLVGSAWAVKIAHDNTKAPIRDVFSRCVSLEIPLPSEPGPSTYRCEADLLRRRSALSSNQML